jgi:heme-degrading monooxygenase HmoA
MPDDFAATPEPPYYAVIFTNRLGNETAGYDETAEAMMELALGQPGCLGAESVRNADGFGITVSYWKDEQSIVAWRNDVLHREARRRGREQWYARYELRVARVERAYGSDG